MRNALLSKLIIRALLAVTAGGILSSGVSKSLATGQILGDRQVQGRQQLLHGSTLSSSSHTQVKQSSLNPPKQAVLLKNGNLFLGKVSSAKNLVQVEVGKKATLVFTTKQVALVADSVDQLYELRSQHLKSWDLKGRKALLNWCLREKLFPQAAKELSRIQKHTIVKKAELDQLQFKLAHSQKMHLEALELAKKAKLQKSRQAKRPAGAIKKMSHQEAAGATKKDKPVIQSVFNIYDGTGLKPKRKANNAGPANSSGNSSLPTIPKLKNDTLPTNGKDTKSSKPAKLKDFDLDQLEKEKTEQSIESSSFQMRPKPDPKRPYDPEVFNRFYHPERFAKKTIPTTKNAVKQDALPPKVKMKTADYVRPAFLETGSLFKDDDKGKGPVKNSKKE